MRYEPQETWFWGFLQQVYRDPAQPIGRQLRAAIAALPFEHPKLAVMAKFDAPEGFAARLEAAIERSGKIIEVKPSASRSSVRM